jgi:hypothetical protein
MKKNEKYKKKEPTENKKTWKMREKLLWAHAEELHQDKTGLAQQSVIQVVRANRAA